MPADDKKTSEPGGRPPPSQWRVLALFLYIAALVVLVKLYWPGWLSPSQPHPPPAAPATGTQVPQN
jgi:hypothetical protein